MGSCVTVSAEQTAAYTLEPLYLRPKKVIEMDFRCDIEKPRVIPR